jgi:predicted FMN-binding regulatory protein PaiB
MAKVQLQKAEHTKIVPTWVRVHVDKWGPPYTDQEQINMLADRLAGTADKALPHYFTSRHDSLHFPVQ